MGLLANSMASKIDRKKYVNTYCKWFAPNGVIHVIRTIGVGSQKNNLHTHRKKHSQIKLQRLEKVWIWAFGLLEH